MKIPNVFNLRQLMLLPLAIVFVLFIVNNVAAAPYQELAPRKGYVPVYIRVGDTPLSEIHPGLAEAFHEEENDGVSKIASADLTLEKNEATAKDSPTEVEHPSETTAVEVNEKVSDIASFEAIKAMDKAESEKQ